MNSDVFEKDDEHRLMIDVSRGLLGIYHGIEHLHKGSNLIIADFPLRWTVSGMGKLLTRVLTLLLLHKELFQLI